MEGTESSRVPISGHENMNVSLATATIKASTLNNRYLAYNSSINHYTVDDVNNFVWRYTFTFQSSSNSSSTPTDSTHTKLYKVYNNHIKLRGSYPQKLNNIVF